jgi:hypothetical protein
MNETLPKKKRKLLIPALAVVGGVLVVGFVVSQAGLDKALVKQKLDESILAIKEKGRAQGRDIDITYGDLEVAGTFLDKRVIVHQPVLTVKPLNRAPLAPGAVAKPDSLVITTDEMAIYPRAVDLSSATFSLAKPVNFAAENDPEKSLLKVEASSPLAVTVSQKTVDGVAHTVTQHTAPATLTLTYLREETATGTEDATPQVNPVYSTLLVNIAQGSTIESDSATDGSGLGHAAIDFGKISLVPQTAPETAIEIAGVHSAWSNVLNEKKLNVVSAKSDIGPTTANADVLPYAPIAFGMDFVFEGAAPKTAPALAAAAGEPTPPQESTITLNKLSFTTKDSSLSAHANFVASPTDILPVGTAELKLTNVPFVLTELRKIGLLNAQTEARYIPLLEQIAGAPIASLTDLEVPIKRERGGSFNIGKTTFEELFALLLKQAIQPKGAGAAPVSEAAPNTVPAPQSRALVPQLPPSDKPKSAPIEVPDHGVRG